MRSLSSVRSSASASASTEPRKDGARARVVQHLRDGIASGNYGAGSVLPPAGTISQRVGVDRNTVYAALDILTEEGLIRSNGGRLRIVNGPVVRPSRVMDHAIVVFTGYEHTDSPEHERGTLAEITRGISRAGFQERKHLLMLAQNFIEEHGIAPLLGADRPAGVIFADFVGDNFHLPAWAGALREGGVSVALFGEDEWVGEFDHVQSDHFAGGAMLVRHLLRSGARNPFALWSSTNTFRYPWQRRRAAGIAEARAEAGLSPREVEFWPTIAPDWDKHPEGFEREVRNLMGYLFEPLHGPNPVDALLAQTDLDFFLLAAACRKLGREPGRDVLITGYDNMWGSHPMHTWESCTDVPFATVDKRNEIIGGELVRLLLDRLSGRLTNTVERRTVEPELIALDGSYSS